MKKPEFRIVRADDWSALYVDGKCVHQDHNVTDPMHGGLIDVLQEHGIDIDYLDAFEHELTNYEFPELLKDVTLDPQ